MRTIGFLITLIFFFTVVQAQNTGSVLHDFLEKMNAAPMTLDFTFTYENIPRDIKNVQKGILVCRGRQFHLDIDEIEIYCDGQNKWILQKEVEEVSIFRAGEVHDITDNPLEYITANIAHFNYKPQMQRSVDKDKNILAVNLVPKDKNAIYTMISLSIEEETLNPVQIVYKMKDGQRYTIDIHDIKPAPGTKNTDFLFPAHAYPDINVIDLR